MIAVRALISAAQPRSSFASVRRAILLSAYTSQTCGLVQKSTNIWLSCTSRVTSYCWISLFLASAFTCSCSREALAVLLGPARVLVLLPVFRWVFSHASGVCQLHVVISSRLLRCWDRTSRHQPSGRRAHVTLASKCGQSARTALNQTGPQGPENHNVVPSGCRPRCRAPEPRERHGRADTDLSSDRCKRCSTASETSRRRRSACGRRCSRR